MHSAAQVWLFCFWLQCAPLAANKWTVHSAAWALLFCFWLQCVWALAANRAFSCAGTDGVCCCPGMGLQLWLLCAVTGRKQVDGAFCCAGVAILLLAVVRGSSPDPRAKGSPFAVPSQGQDSFTKSEVGNLISIDDNVNLNRQKVAKPLLSICNASCWYCWVDHILQTSLLFAGLRAFQDTNSSRRHVII